MPHSKAGDATPYYSGVAMYLASYAMLVVIFFIGSLRTNLVFVGTFFFLEISFWLQIAGYLKIAYGVPEEAASLFKSAGVFGFLTAACVSHCFPRSPFLVVSESAPSFQPPTRSIIYAFPRFESLF
jgi:succinate-acetate transporter protein